MAADPAMSTQDCNKEKSIPGTRRSPLALHMRHLRPAADGYSGGRLDTAACPATFIRRRLVAMETALGRHPSLWEAPLDWRAGTMVLQQRDLGMVSWEETDEMRG